MFVRNNLQQKERVDSTAPKKQEHHNANDKRLFSKLPHHVKEQRADKVHLKVSAYIPGVAETLVK
jgi:hypothetical protein